MFLKSLDIFGFKSFADRTHIDFADGITALLGPNGCGKSNVVDAIKWVLAENKSKNLRADKMEDVIFNGTERRPPLNVAEVTLTILNETGVLPLEEPEIAIKRRLFRSGENEYFINNRPSGPRTIRSLFMDTGIGKAAYSVMEQGKIDQVLSSKPEDRRYLFEEAAGISRSKAECAEAERELERTRTNMQQIEAALAEIKRSYETLKTQAAKTTEYRTVKDTIFSLELDIQLLRLKSFVQDKARTERDVESVKTKRDAVRKEIEDINNTLSENMDRVKAMQESVYRKQADLIGIQKEKGGKLDLIKQFTARRAEIKEKIGQLTAHRATIEAQIEGVVHEIAQHDAELSEKKKQLDNVAQNIQTFARNIATASDQITENNRQAARAKEHGARLDTERAALRTELTAITEDIVTMLDTRLGDAGFSGTALAEAKEHIDATLGRLKVFTQGRRNIFNDFLTTHPRSADDCMKTVAEAVAAFDEANELISGLEAAIARYVKFSPAFITEFLAPEGIMTKKRMIDRQIQENLEQVANLNQQRETLAAENVELEKKIASYRETLERLKVNQAEMQAQIAAGEQHTAILLRTRMAHESALHDNEQEIHAEQTRADDVNNQIATEQETLAAITERGTVLSNELKALDAEIAARNSHVSGKQHQLQKKLDEQNRHQAHFEKLSLALASLDIEIKNLKQNFQDTHSRDLMEFEERMYKITVAPARLREQLTAAREQLKALGSVNLMAPEEFGEVKDRYERQKLHYEDTQKSLENLVRVSEEIQAKSSELFLDTYNKIKRNFHNMFRRLFNGGRAELRLEDPHNVLSSGIDIFAQPPGKKMENIALLSGGEKTMTAVALLFATYQVRPSPFCLLDEIDAALDDKNVSSFVTTLRSFAHVSQYIIITHNKKTVMGAGTMLGITMEESGVSKTIALRLDKDIKVGAEIHEDDGTFVEEDVEPERDAYIPPRPPKRIHHPDGTITDPIQEKKIKEQRGKKSGAPDVPQTGERNAGVTAAAFKQERAGRTNND